MAGVPLSTPILAIVAVVIVVIVASLFFLKLGVQLGHRSAMNNGAASSSGEGRPGGRYALGSEKSMAGLIIPEASSPTEGALAKVSFGETSRDTVGVAIPRLKKAPSVPGLKKAPSIRDSCSGSHEERISLASAAEDAE